MLTRTEVVKEIKARGVEVIEALLVQFPPAVKPRREGNLLVFSRRRNDASPSCKLHLDGSLVGMWHDYGTGESGDCFTLLAEWEGMNPKAKKDFPVVAEKCCILLGLSWPAADQKDAAPAKKRKRKDGGEEEYDSFTFGPLPSEEEFAAQYGLVWQNFLDAGCKTREQKIAEAGWLEMPVVVYPYALHEGGFGYKYGTVQRVVGPEGAGEIGRRVKRAIARSGAENGFFGDPARAKGATLVLTGGEEKRIAVEAAGFIASNIANERTCPRQYQWLMECELAEIIIAFDADKAGRMFTEKLAAALLAAGFKGKLRAVAWSDEHFKWTHPLTGKHGYDINTHLLAEGMDALKSLIGSAPVFVPSPQDSLATLPCQTTDIANGMRFAQQHRGKVVFVEQHKVWRHYDGKCWVLDESEMKVAELSKLTAAKIFDEVGESDDPHAMKKWARESSNLSKMTAMRIMASSEPGMHLNPSLFDANEWLLNLKNGTLNIQTGKVSPHRPEDYMTRTAVAHYDPEAKCPLWDKFIRRIMRSSEGKERPDLVEYLQRAIGYSITGNTAEQCFFILLGGGNNGKGTFIETLKKVLGDYARQADPSTFMETKVSADKPRPDLVALVGARFVPCSEIDKGQKLGDALIKSLTGQDTQTFRTLYGSYFEWLPSFKLWMSTNHLPVISSTDLGIWRRIRLINFETTITPEEVDPQMREKLFAEAPGILNWCIQGALKWSAAGGLGSPKELTDAVAEYRRDSDTLADFIGDMCDTGKELRERAGDLYAAYQAFQEKAGNKRVSSQKGFGMALKERGFKNQRGGAGVHIWVGLRLRKAPDGTRPLPDFDPAEPTGEQGDAFEPEDGAGSGRREPGEWY